MQARHQILTMLREEFRQWDELLVNIGEEQVSTLHAPQKPYNSSLKDVVAHLAAWQQVSLARAEAANADRCPEFPAWLAGRDPDVDGFAELDQLNDSIYEAAARKSWTSIYLEWRHVFLRFLEMAEKLPEKDLEDAGRFPWLKGHPLSLVFLNCCKHHREHRELFSTEDVLDKDVE